MRTLEMLAQVAEGCHDAVHEATLHDGVNAGRDPGAAHTSVALFRRDVICVLHERGYIQPGAERRTWHISAAGRDALPRLRNGERVPAKAPAPRRGWAASPANADDDEDDADAQAEGAAARARRQQPAQGADAEPPNPLLAAAVRCGMQRRAMSDADAHPCTSRAGSEQALGHPSRRGNRLYWRDGRVTDLQGAAA
jgi:hypothetical protein